MTSPRYSQRGIALFIVMVMVLLSTLLVMWAARTALFNEMITGNDSDYQRAFEAAQAMVRDAEFDIMGTRADGTTVCNADAAYSGCRPLAGSVFFPQDELDFQDLADALRAQTPSCSNGICIGDNLPASEFWISSTHLAAMTASGVAATYGAHTAAKATEAGNPLLLTAGVTPRAWYWVEVLPYNAGAVTEAGPAQKFAPDNGSPYVYRITAIAQGLKPGSRAVVQTVFVRKRVSS